MGDRTPRGRTVDEATAWLKARKMELDIASSELEIKRLDYTVAELDVQKQRHEATMAALRQRITELHAELEQSKEHSIG